MSLKNIEKLHEIYCTETHLAVACTLVRHFTWEAFLARGFTEDDLRTVCRGLRKEVNSGRRTIGSMSFHLLVGDLEYFEERLAEFRALQRKPIFSKGKADVLKATGRPAEPEQPPARKAALALERTKLAEQLREFRKKL